MGNHKAVNTREKPQISASREKANIKSRGPDRDIVRVENRYWLGRPAARNGLWLRDDLLATAARMAKSRRMGQNTPRNADQITTSRPNRFFACGGRFVVGACCFWGAKTGPNPTDRRKKGSKHHLVTDANGIPLSVILTGANRHDVTQLLPLVDSIPPIAGKIGRPLQHPDSLLGDRAYDSEPHRRQLRSRRIVPLLAKRWTENGSGLGIYRWVVERTISWLHQNRRLRIRYEKRDDIHQAFMTIGCIKICWNHLLNYPLC
jgi:transposase